jgi:arylsulfatase A-like enzyme
MKTLVLLLALFTGTVTPAVAAMNVLVILTDDQRFDSVATMPNLSDLAAHGVTFANAFMPTPLCGPSRAMLFSGGYRSQNTGVLSNDLPNGGVKLFKDSGNIGAALQAAGYRTQFVGKWINGYEGLGTYVPPGWTKWVGRHSYATSTSWSAFRYTIGSSSQKSSTGAISTAHQYTTDFERDQVLNFITSTPDGQPFFILWATSAPHPPATPAAQDDKLIPGYVYRGRGYGETDLSDKSAWVRSNTVKYSDEFVRDQLRSLQSVDRAVAALVAKLKDVGRFNDTLIIFTSDNGFLWGEHGLWAKDKAYEESIRVPLIVVMPGVAPRTDESLVLPSLDIGPTAFEIAGVSKETDGMSLVPLLTYSGQAWRTEFFSEHVAENPAGNAIWAGVRDSRWKYVRYWTGEEELYDLNADPYELNSLHKDASLGALKTMMRSRTDQQLGLAIIPVRSFPSCRVQVRFNFQMQPWGGAAPLSWKVEAGQLPPGLALNPATGVIQGTPTKSGSYRFSVRVADSSLATQAGIAKTFLTRPMTLVVKTETDRAGIHP